MSDYKEVQATINSAGAKIIAKAMMDHHQAIYAKYRTCGSMDELLNLQTIQKVIDTTLPQILTGILNKHVEPKTPPKSEEWWRFDKWLVKMLK